MWRIRYMITVEVEDEEGYGAAMVNGGDAIARGLRHVTNADKEDNGIKRVASVSCQGQC